MFKWHSALLKVKQLNSNGREGLIFMPEASPQVGWLYKHFLPCCYYSINILLYFIFTLIFFLFETHFSPFWNEWDLCSKFFLSPCRSPLWSLIHWSHPFKNLFWPSILNKSQYCCQAAWQQTNYWWETKKILKLHIATWLRIGVNMWGRKRDRYA